MVRKGFERVTRTQGRPRLQDAHARHHGPWPMLLRPRRARPGQRLRSPGHRPTTRGSAPVGIVMEKFQLVSHRRDDGQHVPERRADAGLAGRERGVRLVQDVAVATSGRKRVEAWSEPPYSHHWPGHRYDGQLRPALPALPLLRDRRSDPQAVAPEEQQQPLLHVPEASGGDRGAAVQVLMGDARRRMHLPYGWRTTTRRRSWPTRRSIRSRSPTAGRRTSTT